MGGECPCRVDNTYMIGVDVGGGYLWGERESNGTFLML